MKKVISDTFGFISFPKPVSTKKNEKPQERAKLGQKKASRIKKTKRIKLQPLHLLMKKADFTFSRWIRNRDGNQCVLCGSRTNVQCGHLIKRGKKAVRFNELNCHALCGGCNYRDNYDHDIYVNWFINKYDKDNYFILFSRSRAIKKWTRNELENIIKQYRYVI